MFFLNRMTVSLPSRLTLCRLFPTLSYCIVSKIVIVSQEDTQTQTRRVLAA
jgi:hypothetical protein